MSTFTLKVVAVITMTLAHLNSFFPEFPLIFNWIGRIAAPIFLFCTVEAFVHTSDRLHLTKRLYVTTIICGTIGTIFDIPNNFIGTLFLTTLVLTIIETFKENKKRGCLIAGIFLLYQISFIVFMQLIGIGSRESFFVISVLGISFFEGTSTVFIVLGVIFYLTRLKKSLLSCSYLAFCGIYYICDTTVILNRGEDWLARHDLNMIADLFGILRQLIGFGRFQVGGNPLTENYQWMMVFALPFLLCYNGKKGGDSKHLGRFFYIYYPSHLFLLALFSKIL